MLTCCIKVQEVTDVFDLIFIINNLNVDHSTVKKGREVVTYF